MDVETLPVGAESLGITFEKWKIPLDSPVEMYEALAIIPSNGGTILMSKKYTLALADAIIAKFTDDR